MSCEETDEDIPPFLMEKAKMAGLQAVCAHREPLLCLADGVSVAKTVDEMFRSWFRAEKGPCEMMDAVGLDTVYNIEVVHQAQLGLNPKAKNWLKAALVDKGNLENKSGKDCCVRLRWWIALLGCGLWLLVGLNFSMGCTSKSKVHRGENEDENFLKIRMAYCSLVGLE